MKIRLLVGIAAAAIVLSAIALAGTAAKSSDQNKIRVAFFPNISHAVPIVGMENGEFAKELGNIPIQTIIVDSGPQAIEALFANSVDIAYVGPSPFINGYVKSGQGIKILSGAAHNGASLVIQKDSEISEISDLAGKKVAAPSIGNTQDVSLRYYLSENGLKPAERGGNVIIYNTANSETYTLFAKGDINAAWVPEPTATILVEELGGKRLFDEEELWPNKQFPSVLLIARTDFVEKHPDWIKGWLAANQNTIQWINQNPQKTEQTFIDFYKKHTGKTLPENIVHGSFSHIKFTSDPDPESMKIFAQRAYDLGYLGRSGYNIDGIFHTDTMGVLPWQS
jgi:NitT/TauT family transport system substrate-binding protein